MAKLLDLSVYGPGHISNILQVDASVYAKAFITDGGKDTQVVRGDGTLASISSLSVGNADTVDNKHASDFAASSHSHPYLPLAGGIMTGNISYGGTYSTNEMIAFINNVNDSTGNGIRIGGGGATLVGGGESANQTQTLLGTGGDEKLILSNDQDIEFYTYCQNGISGAYKYTMNTSGGFDLSGDILASISSTTYRQISVKNSNGQVGIYAASNRGLHDFTSNVWIISHSSAGNAAQISKPLYVNTTSYQTSYALRVSGTSQFDGNLSVSGTGYFSSNLTTDGTLTVNGHSGYFKTYIFLNSGSDGIYLSTSGLSWHDSNNSYSSSLFGFSSNSITAHQPLTIGDSTTYSLIGPGYIKLRNYEGVDPTSNKVAIEFSYHGGQEMYISYTPNDSYRMSKGLKIWGSSSDPSNPWLEVEGNVYGNGFVKHNSSSSHVLLGDGGHKPLSDFSMSHSHPYLPTSGGTLTGPLNTAANLYHYNSTYGINMNNSDIVGVNSIVTGDLAESGNEGIKFYRDDTHYDSLWVQYGELYFTQNMVVSNSGCTGGTQNTILHTGNYSSTLDGRYYTEAEVNNLLAQYLPLNGGTMNLGEGLKFHSDDNYFGTNLDARIISLIDGNGTTCDGGLIIDERATSNNKETITELLRITHDQFKWKGADILTTSNYSSTLDPRYVNTSGDTMTGPLTLAGEQYNGNYALSLQNSNIVGVNAIFMNDVSEDAGEGLQFPRSNGKYDSVWAQNGEFYFSPNGSNSTQSGTYSTNYIVIHSGNYDKYLGYIGTTAVQKTSTAQSLTGIINYDATGYIKTTGFYVNVGAQIDQYDTNRTEFALINSKDAPSMLELGVSGARTWGIESRGSERSKDFSIYNWDSAEHQFVISHATGFVGIKNTSPAYTLDVTGAGRIYDIIFEYNDEINRYGGNLLLQHRGNRAGSAGAARTGNIIMCANTGKVAIGHSSPEESLHIHNGQVLISCATTHRDLYYRVSGINYAVRFGLGSGGVNRGIYDDSNSSWMIYRDNTTNVIIPNGKIGIGTSAPGYKLDVQGTGYFSGSLTTDGSLTVNGTHGYFKNYVFLNSYGEGIYLSTNGISWHDSSNSYVTNLFTFAKYSITANQPVTLNSDLTISGGLTFTSTSGIYYKGTKATYQMLSFIDNSADEYGNGIRIGGGGATLIGGGESSGVTASLLSSGGDERMIISNDQSIEFYTYCQDGVISSAKKFEMDVNGNFLLNGNILASASDTTYREISAKNSNGQVGVYAATNRGLHDDTASVWIISHSKDGAAAQISRPLYVNTTSYQTSYALYVNGTSMMGGTTTVSGHVNPGTTKSYNVGSTSSIWSNGYYNYLHVRGTTVSSVTYDSANPKIIFSEDGIQEVCLVYNDHDVYRSPAGLKVCGSQGGEWFEVAGSVYAAGYYKTDGTAVSYSGHTHDGRYYTESEVNSLLAGKANSSHSHSYLPLSGGNMTGNIGYSGSQGSYSMIRFLDNVNNNWGAGISIGAGGLTIVGAGESATSVEATVTDRNTESLYLSADDAIYILSNAETMSNGYQMKWQNGALSVAGTVTGTAFYESSDIRLKQNVKQLFTSSNIPQIKQFDWKESGKHSYGLIAQELESMGYSELVDVKDDGYKSVNYTAAHSLIIGKLQLKIKELEDRIKYLESK